MSHHHHSSDSSSNYAHQLGHIVPKEVYRNVFIALIDLTILTVFVAGIDISPGWNVTIALAVASIKAILVLLFFMHMKYESKTTWIFVAFPIALVIIMIAGVYSDNPLRVHTEPVKIVATAK